MQNLSKLIKITILAVSILFMQAVTAGCSKNEGQQQNAQLQAAKEKQAQEKESEKLKKIEENIEMLFEALEGPSVKSEESGEGTEKQQKGEEQVDQKKNSEQQSGEEKQNENEGTQPQSGQKGGNQNEGTQIHGGGKQPEQKAPDKWSQVGRIINNLHYQWNDLMPEIAKKGADMKLVDNFDNALNDLTTTIETKNQDNVLISANKLYSHVPDLYSLYRVKMSPEVKRMIYYTRNIILVSAKDGWEQVGKDNEALEKSWSLFQNTLEKEQKTIGDKLDFSIYELKKVVTEKNKQLTDIKGRIVLNNIKELQKSFEKEK